MGGGSEGLYVRMAGRFGHAEQRWRVHGAAHRRTDCLLDRAAQAISRSRRAAIMPYEATRATARAHIRSVGIACYTRSCGRRRGGDPWLACKGQGFHRERPFYGGRSRRAAARSGNTLATSAVR